MEMEDQFGMADLRQFINGRSQFAAIPQPPDPFSGHHHHHQHYDMMMLRHLPRADSSTTTATTATATSAAAVCGLDSEAAACLGGDGGSGRWPRQETLTLLEIRSRLDPKFKEANQKGPLWDEVSRIMSEEHGYQRSGKKCREKFENLYKYYKKTKEGKAGRQDGKHYRFFRQLEALYGETSNSTNQQISVTETHLLNNSLPFHTSQGNYQESFFQAHKLSTDSLSLSNSSEFDTSSSEENEKGGVERRRRWKAKIKDFIDSQMKKLMEKQEAWLEKMVKTLESKEEERMMREEEWRKQLEREHKFWANERAWIEARDAALMAALQKLSSKGELKASSSSPPVDQYMINWEEPEITRLIQIRTSMEARFQQSGCAEEVLWEEIATKMACLGYESSASMCKNKWDRINSYLTKSECNNNKKRRESSRNCFFQNNEMDMALEEHRSSSPSNSNISNSVNDSCFPFMMVDGENMWDGYNVKLNKG